MECIFLVLVVVASVFFLTKYFREKCISDTLSNEEKGILNMINKSHIQTFQLPVPIVASENFLDALNSLSEKGMIHALVSPDGKIFYEISEKAYW